MPTYLRWIAAMTSGITVFFIYTMLTLGIITAASDTTELGRTEGGLVSLGAGLMMMLAALAVNDWLYKRYPPPSRRADETRRAEHEVRR